ncbi:MAG: prepilin-type N-terminal cleavage/methylation domain-containing protein [Clostridia bacterium]|nr:prepilin-type N-terminal cleavage/methylation domain-containing protein [Clostridia bacterium]
MKKRIFERKINARRGFSLAEVVVAIAIIVIVSSASMTLIGVQARTEAKSVATVEATNIAENAIECFRYAQNTGTDFESVFGYASSTTGEGTEADPYIIKKDGATVIIRITGNTMTVNATFAGDAIFEEITYTKK